MVVLKIDIHIELFEDYFKFL